MHGLRSLNIHERILCSAACFGISFLLAGCAWTSFLEGESDVEEADAVETVGTVASPELVLTPASGPVGTRIRIAGTGFDDPFWRSGLNGGYGISLQRMLAMEGVGACDLVAGFETGATIDSAGRLTAELIIPPEGGCFQTDRTAEVVPGVYGVIVGCHTCQLGTFRVTE